MMIDKAMLDDTGAAHFPLEHTHGTMLLMDEPPPAYEDPKIDFSSGWKDRIFAIIFYIHVIGVITVGLVLGLPAFIASIKENSWNQLKRIPFAEAHLGAGCAVLRSHPSLLLIAFIMLIVELLWFFVWCLMVLGIQRASNNTIFIFNINSTMKINNETKFNMIYTKSTPSHRFSSMTTRMPKFSDTIRYSMDRNSKSINSTMKRTNDEIQWSNATNDSTSSKQGGARRIVSYIILFLVLLSWYWGAATFGNISHFVTACAVGHWWFTGEGSRQYTIGTSVRRAFTTNFGTICLGSLLEAIIKALRACISKDGRKNIIAAIADCILQILEKLIGYLNEWAFIYAALTGQTFVEAGRSFIELFKKRGWTAIINDVLVGSTMMIVNIAIGLTSAIVGGLLIYFFMSDSPEKIIAIIMASIVSFIISLFMSALMASVLSSCVRTVFVCFALNPAALGATHPDHLQALTNAWHKFYPQEFAVSGYTQHLPKPTMTKDL
ncbi:unnamed protein product [Rotaria sp. Silwood2]|nr:unnamed protein product [Rotaria sp. Silwood2]